MVHRMKTEGFVKHLKEWGLEVEVTDGWKTRGRPYDFYPRGVICHHTASNKDSGDFASQSIVTNGRSDLPGPLCQFLLGRNGTVKVIAAGYANHGGEGGPHAGIPADQANSYTFGIEAENNGIGEPWPREQMVAYVRLCAALLDWVNVDDVSRVFGHKEWTSRKIDPAGIDMSAFRSAVRKALNNGPHVVTVSLSKVKPGLKNDHVEKVQRRLKNRGLFTTRITSKYGYLTKRAYRKWQQDLGYEGKDADGIAGRTSLEKLGFRVVD